MVFNEEKHSTCLLGIKEAHNAFCGKHCKHICICLQVHKSTRKAIYRLDVDIQQCEVQS